MASTTKRESPSKIKKIKKIKEIKLPQPEETANRTANRDA
jgi:hypothetical protein